MFVWECMKTKGTHLGMCMDGFMFGSCCIVEGNDDINKLDSGQQVWPLTQLHLFLFTFYEETKRHLCPCLFPFFRAEKTEGLGLMKLSDLSPIASQKAPGCAGPSFHGWGSTRRTKVFFIISVSKSLVFNEYVQQAICGICMVRKIRPGVLCSLPTIDFNKPTRAKGQICQII